MGEHASVFSGARPRRALLPALRRELRRTLERRPHFIWIRLQNKGPGWPADRKFDLAPRRPPFANRRLQALLRRVHDVVRGRLTAIDVGGGHHGRHVTQVSILYQEK